jgi:glycosyltransferase 2 family protein
MLRVVRPGFVVRAGLSVGLIAFLLWRIDLSDAADALRTANYLYVLPALALFGVSKVIVAMRWRLMMSKFASLPLRPLFGILLVSNLANNVVPARLGDLVRVQVPAQRYGTSRARVGATVFATESLLDGIAFAVMGLIGLALIDVPVFPTEIFWAFLGLVVGGLLAVIPLSHLKFSDGWLERGTFGRLPERLRVPLRTMIPHFIDGLAVFREPRMALQALVMSFSIVLLEVGMFALFGEAFGIELSLPAWMLIMVVANVVTAVPVTPSNIGAYEVAMTEVVVALGVGAGTAGGFAVASHAFNILWVGALGIIAMQALRLSTDDVFSLRRREEVEVVRVGDEGEPDDAASPASG